MNAVTHSAGFIDPNPRNVASNILLKHSPTEPMSDARKCDCPIANVPPLWIPSVDVYTAVNGNKQT